MKPIYQYFSIKIFHYSVLKWPLRLGQCSSTVDFTGTHYILIIDVSNKRALYYVIVIIIIDSLEMVKIWSFAKFSTFAFTNLLMLLLWQWKCYITAVTCTLHNMYIFNARQY